MVRNVLNPWVILGAILFGVLLLLGSFSLLTSTRSAPAPSGPATAILTIIPAPSPTLPGSTPIGVSNPTITPEVTPTPNPGTIAVGAFVQVAGTGGDGLRLRSEPNLKGDVRFLGLETEEADDYTWWYLVAPYDEQRVGWAVAPYLVIIQNP